MRTPSKLSAVWSVALAMAPVIAAGRPACCLPTPPPPASAHACCPAKAQAEAMAPKGCCKAPVAPKSETKVRDAGAIAMALPDATFGTPASVPTAFPQVVSVRLARRAHHAEAPDDSPPDRLSLTRLLLI